LGFFSDLVSVALPILGTALGGPAGGLAGGAIAQQINRPPTGGTAARPTFPAAPGQEPPSFLSQLGSALVPIAGAVLQSQLAPRVQTTTIPIEPGAIGAVPGFGGPTRTTAEKEAEFARRRRLAALLDPTIPPGPKVFAQPRTSLMIGAPLLIPAAQAVARVAANPLVGGFIGTAAAIQMGQIGGRVLQPGAIPTSTTGPGPTVLGAFTSPGRSGMAGTFRQTVVQTIDRTTGNVVKQELFRGSPFLMNHDIVVAKKVFRMASKLHGRLPRKSVKRRVIDCPPINEFINTRALSHVLSSKNGG